MISVSNLARDFGSTRAVAGLSFDVSEGELFGIVGPDGAGKTTTLRMLAGVLRPTSGDAVIASTSVASHPEAVKSRIAYMPQRFGLYADLTVRENIEFYADLYRVPKNERPRRLDRLFVFSNLGTFQERLAGNLSGGMKQKLSLCCALIHQPSVLLLDEPTFGVDPISRRDLWLILHEMVVEGVTIIVSTSYLDEAERCDRVALLHKGRVMALDTPESLLGVLPGDVISVHGPDPRAARDLLRTIPGVASTALFGNSLHAVVEGHRDVENLAIEAMSAAGLAGYDIELVEPSLEDVFLHLVMVEEEASVD